MFDLHDFATVGIGNAKLAKVIKTDVMASNGVIHVIDQVLIPPTISEALKKAAATATTASTSTSAPAPEDNDADQAGHSFTAPAMMGGPLLVISILGLVSPVLQQA